MEIDQTLKARLIDEFRRYDDNTVFELISDIVMELTRHFDNKGALSDAREIVVLFKMKMGKLDFLQVGKRIECGIIHLQLEECLKISKNYSDELSLLAKDRAIETLSLATRDWLVSTELPHFIKENDNPDVSIGRFYLYLLDNIGY